jgi:hypothetical protein
VKKSGATLGRHVSRAKLEKANFGK